ncbi:uncharacterized protein LOC141914285 [Tubulanus polymorphus]|uniref:uncharacterized protein LOC141914285 n=1 Tax=Tubulanus polymorphus TaxID=672921 RepID=UPI003DA32E4E
MTFRITGGIRVLTAAMSRITTRSQSPSIGSTLTLARSHQPAGRAKIRKASNLSMSMNSSLDKSNHEEEQPAKRAEIMPSQVQEQTDVAMEESVTTPNRIKLLYHKLSEHALAPVRGSKFAAGLDLCSAHDYTIEANGKVCAMTDIQIALPDGCYGRVAPRSGLAWKHHIDVGAGVIDQDYRGNVGVVLFNHNSKSFSIKRGDRVAQLILERIYIPDIVESETKLPETERGAGGFGSTGGVSCSGDAAKSSVSDDVTEKTATDGAAKKSGTNGTPTKSS